MKFLGRLAPDELPALYQHARALIVPSLCYETFGIIIIEAFRTGNAGSSPAGWGLSPKSSPEAAAFCSTMRPSYRAAICRVQTDSNYREVLSRQARQAYERKLSDRRCPKISTLL